MERKQFLIRIAGPLGLMPLLITQVGCDDPYAPRDTAGTGDPNSFTVISTVDAGHSHGIIISLTDVNSPPEANQTLTSDGSHTHTIVLTTADYTALGNGEQLTKLSSNDDNHTHTFTIKVP